MYLKLIGSQRISFSLILSSQLYNNLYNQQVKKYSYVIFSNEIALKCFYLRLKYYIYCVKKGLEKFTTFSALYCSAIFRLNINVCGNNAFFKTLGLVKNKGGGDFYVCHVRNTMRSFKSVHPL